MCCFPGKHSLTIVFWVVGCSVVRDELSGSDYGSWQHVFLFSMQLGGANEHRKRQSGVICLRHSLLSPCWAR